MKQVRKRNDDRGEGAFLCVRACVGVGDLAPRVACGFGDDSLLFQPRRQVRETGEGPGRRLAGHPRARPLRIAILRAVPPLTASCVGRRQVPRISRLAGDFRRPV